MTEAGTKLWLRTADLALVTGGCVLAGAVVGVGLPHVWGSAKDWDWIPFRDVLAALMSLDVPWVVVVRPVVLALTGLGVALVIIDDVPEVTLTDDEILVKKGRDTRAIRRDQVAGVYRERSKVVIESPAGRRLFYDNLEGGRQAVQDAFIAHGYPWEGR